MTKKFNHYLGKAGHLAVMSEFLMRGWNVAIPEVDIGDDIFVVQDEDGTLRRVQVKTSTATTRKNGYSCQFQVPLKQLRTVSNVPVHYVFLARNLESWSKPIIIRQDYLLDHFDNNQVGSQSGLNINLYFAYDKSGKVKCSTQDFTGYVADYTDFPLVDH